MGEGGHRLEEFVHVMQMRHQLEPEGDFGGAVVVPDPGLQADVEVQLLFGSVLRPGHLFKAVRFRVDELGVLRNGLIWITGHTHTHTPIYYYPHVQGLVVLLVNRKKQSYLNILFFK